MTTKEFAFFAKKIQDLPDDCIMDKERLTAWLSVIFSGCDENFNIDKFYAACGVTVVDFSTGEDDARECLDCGDIIPYGRQTCDCVYREED